MNKSWIHCLQNEEICVDQLLYASEGFKDNNKVTQKVKNDSVLESQYLWLRSI